MKWFAPALLIVALLVPSVARGEDQTRTFGGCNTKTTFCYGPTTTVSVVGYSLKSGEFTLGLIPGAGYGVTFFADKTYQLGLGGYAAIQKANDTTVGMFSAIASFAQYLRFGWGWQITGHERDNLLLLGLGADL